VPHYRSRPHTQEMSASPKIIIVGAGVAGMVFALAMAEQTGIKCYIYEGAPAFSEGAGGAIGLYPNGEKVIRDLCGMSLLRKILLVAKPYHVRRWMKHTGQDIATASESELMIPGEPELIPIGIRRSRLLKVLTDECELKGIKIHFDKRLVDVKTKHGATETAVATFHDSTTVEADILLGADGIKSVTRVSIFGSEEPVYSGVTVTMGISPNKRAAGICFPSGPERTHACIYPTQDNECTFQIYQHEPVEQPESWKTLSGSAAEADKQKLASDLAKQGWSSDIVTHVKDADNLIRLGVRFRKPLTQWYKGPCVLIGDAAHAIVPVRSGLPGRQGLTL
jgi:salicylate hydroxylase